MFGRVEWIEVTMICRSVEISITGAIAETEDRITTVTAVVSLFFLFLFFISYISC